MDVAMMHRRAVESRYIGICSVYEFVKVTDNTTKLTKSNEKIVFENVPCRLSFSNIPAASGNGTVVSKQQTVKLFLAPEISIKAGSKIVVTQNGVTQEYKNSGEAAIYESHQEINLELFRRWT